MADLLDMDYINSLPQPFLGCTRSGWWWPVHDIEVQTGLVRIDVCGLLEVKDIGDFKSFKDDTGTEHPAHGFYSDALPEERTPARASAGGFSPSGGGESNG